MVKSGKGVDDEGVDDGYRERVGGYNQGVKLYHKF